MSRKLISTFFVSLDGVVEAPQDWHFPYFNDEMTAAIGATMASSGAMLCGRVTYQEWAGFWPDADNEMAAFMNETPKYVASTTLDDVDWSNSHLLEGDVPAAVAALKEQPGKDIVMSGSATLARSLRRGLRRRAARDPPRGGRHGCAAVRERRPARWRSRTADLRHWRRVCDLPAGRP